jgi:2-oxoglutarate dehydrogenase N-terminus
MLALTSRRAAGRLSRCLAVAGRELHSSNDAGQAHPKPVALSKLKDSFLDGTSSTYLEELEQRYREDPASVDRTWASFFRSMGEWGEMGGGVGRSGGRV